MSLPIGILVLLLGCSASHDPPIDAGICDARTVDGLPPPSYQCVARSPEIDAACDTIIGHVFDGTHCVPATGCIRPEDDDTIFPTAYRCAELCSIYASACNWDKIRPAVGDPGPVCFGSHCTELHIVFDATVSPEDYGAAFESMRPGTAGGHCIGTGWEPPVPGAHCYEFNDHGPLERSDLYDPCQLTLHPNVREVRCWNPE